MNRSVIFFYIFNFYKAYYLLPFDINIHLPVLGQPPFAYPIQIEAVVPSSAHFLRLRAPEDLLCDIHIVDKKHLFQLT